MLSIRGEVVEELLSQQGGRVASVLDAARRARTAANRRKRWHAYEDAVEMVVREYGHRIVDRPDATMFHRAFVLWDSLDKTGEPEDLDLASTPAHVRRRIMEQLEVFGASIGLYRSVVRDVAKYGAGRVMELGCGGGELAGLIAAETGAEVIATDIDASSFPAHAPAGVTYQVADAADLSDFGDDSVDLVLCTLMLHHLPPGKAARVLAEMDRVGRVAYVLDLARIPVVPGLFRMAGALFYDERFVHDGTVSFARARTHTELRLLATLAGWRTIHLLRRIPAFSILTSQPLD